MSTSKDDEVNWRCDELLKLGMVFDGCVFIYQDIRISFLYIAALNTELFEHQYYHTKKMIEQRKAANKSTAKESITKEKRMRYNIIVHHSQYKHVLKTIRQSDRTAMAHKIDIDKLLRFHICISTDCEPKDVERYFKSHDIIVLIDKNDINHNETLFDIDEATGNILS